MRFTRFVVLVALAGGCSEPVLKNVPHPPAAQAAGAAAAVAAAATLADPERAAARGEAAKKAQEENGAPPAQGVAAGETVPPAVLDRLDHAAPVDAGVDGRPPR